ncbi:CDP-diacylglycerol--glycerol-3-phosphate 3-phosphatidyltransferase [Sedimentibacter acidaminivorans]|jgi:CDP-diacylglycerol---glycerol-3-phosphate 3-phosphatidyltransferase|uniref:CDP-diacylglycerol--glycerol-3-phosphate 3-phosphatidyltransferase n=1 Tax=Sedimentibacter acidaminivorans TaxID=913099 RepID=A0ABS4GCB9_9FIRM|nr:CDP-diacylglycerol--glycerol-3-phosphate 3-phosphatidyltransferase [Sedimentibacter acidaminivorans]MBP1925307.1 CDP-diacylglycerol--glycerol-3-phosphate 3-phosphatidyltransferase [Sedimentibacter acidaminivorans]
MNYLKTMNLPNKLTLLRILLIPLFLFFLFISGGVFRFLPLLIFIGAAVTDAIDGHIARRDNLITDFGKFMDPLADKLLTASAFIAFVEIGYLSSWIVVLIISREFLISGFRTLAASKGVTIAANNWGKVKTIFQMLLIIILLMDYTGYIGFVSPSITPLIIITVLLTIISGATYIYDNLNVIK